MRGALIRVISMPIKTETGHSAITLRLGKDAMAGAVFVTIITIFGSYNLQVLKTFQSVIMEILIKSIH
jgi:hypothetical protein